MSPLVKVKRIILNTGRHRYELFTMQLDLFTIRYCSLCLCKFFAEAHQAKADHYSLTSLACEIIRNHRRYAFTQRLFCLICN